MSIDLGWLTLAVVLAFASAIPGDFVWWDHVDIEQAGYRITDAGDWHLVWVTTREQYRSRRAGDLADGAGCWRPVYALSLSLDWLLWKDRAWCYRVENVLWHLLVVGGLYLLGRRLFDSLPAGRRIVFWAAMLFAVHPFGVYSVARISGRTDTLCAAFGVGALLAFSHVAANSERAPSNWVKTTLWLILSCICLALSVGSKELGMVVPLVATALYWPFKSCTARNVRLAGLGLLWVCSVALVVYRSAVVGAWGPATSYPTDSILGNAAMSANLWWHYVARILTPFEIRLSDAWPVVRTIGIVEIFAMLGIFVLMVVLVYGFRRRWPWILGLWWYVLWMLPALGLAPLVYFRAESYLYPASWGLLLAVVMFFLLPASHFESKSPSGAVAVGLSGITAWLIATTAYTNMFWKDDSSLFNHAIKQDSRHIEARMMLARLAFERGQPAETVRQLRRVTRDIGDTSFVAHADRYRAHTELGAALLRLRLNTEALGEFQAALQYQPHNPAAHGNVGLAASALGSLQTAKKHYMRSLELEPNSTIGRHNLAVTLIRLGEAETCIELLRGYVKDHEDDLICLSDYAAALLVLERFEEAEPHFDRLAVKQAENPIYRAQLAWCQWETGKQEEAKQNLKEAQKKAPNHPVVLQAARIVGQEQAELEHRGGTDAPP